MSTLVSAAAIVRRLEGIAKDEFIAGYVISTPAELRVLLRQEREVTTEALPQPAEPRGHRRRIAAYDDPAASAAPSR